MNFKLFNIIPKGVIPPICFRDSPRYTKFFYSSFTTKHLSFEISPRSIYSLKCREFSQASPIESTKIIQDKPESTNISENSTKTTTEAQVNVQAIDNANENITDKLNSTGENEHSISEFDEHSKNFIKAAALAKESAQAQRNQSKYQDTFVFPFNIFKSFTLIGVTMIGTGYIYSYCIENKLTFKEFSELAMQISEDKQNAFNDYLSDIMDKFFPLTSEPLLIDGAEMNMPENMPTLVIDFNKVISHLEYDRRNGWQVVKRPGADRFFKELFNYYEIIIWSDDVFPIASEALFKWGLPVMGCIHRDQCMKRRGHYVKDLSRLGRKLERTIIIDHDPFSYMLQPENGILVREFTGDPNDTELDSLIDLLKHIAVSNDDVRTVLRRYEGSGTDIGYKFMVEKAEEDKKAESARTFGKSFGFNSGSRSNFGLGQIPQQGVQMR